MPRAVSLSLLSLKMFPLMLALSSCVAFVPLIEPDEQALAAGRSTVSYGSGSSTRSYGTPGAKRRDRKQAKLGRYIRIMQSGEAVERAHAAFWLGEMGQPAEEAVPILVANLRHENHWVRRASAKALGKIGSPQAVDPLRGALSDRNKFVAHSAANALRKIGTRQALAALKGYKGI
jgi:HEAT repeat protein